MISRVAWQQGRRVWEPLELKFKNKTNDEGMLKYVLEACEVRNPRLTVVESPAILYGNAYLLNEDPPKAEKYRKSMNEFVEFAKQVVENRLDEDKHFVIEMPRSVWE